jgi:uncharacterized membrane protein YqiK
MSESSWYLGVIVAAVIALILILVFVSKRVRINSHTDNKFGY